MSEIRDAGSGLAASVKQFRHARVQIARMKVSALQHHEARTIAAESGDSYTAICDFGTVNNSTFYVALLKNTDTEGRLMIVHRLELAFYDYTIGTALPSANTYWEICRGGDYSSGGSAVTPGNTNATSGRTASVTCYDNNPTPSGTITSLWYRIPTAETEVISLDTEGALVAEQGGMFSVRITSDCTAGVARANIHFSMFDALE